jgi:hypothetical protein
VVKGSPGVGRRSWFPAGWPGEAAGLPGCRRHARDGACGGSLPGGRVGSGFCGFGVLRGARGWLGVHGVDSGKFGLGGLCGRPGWLGGQFRGRRVDTQNRGFGGWRGRLGRLGVQRVGSGNFGFGVLRGWRDWLGVHGVDSGNFGFGVLWRSRDGSGFMGMIRENADSQFWAASGATAGRGPGSAGGCADRDDGSAPGHEGDGDCGARIAVLGCGDAAGGTRWGHQSRRVLAQAGDAAAAGGSAWRGKARDMRRAPDKGPTPEMWGVLVCYTNMADERERRCRLQNIDPTKDRRVFGSGRRCVASENVVAIFCRLVAREALCVQRLVAGFAVREVGESPASGRDVLF